MLDIIEEIAEAKGSAKIEVMKAHPWIKKVLEYAYNPFKRYYMSAPTVDGVDDPMGITDIPYHVLDQLSTRHCSGKAAFERVCDLIKTLSPSYAELFKRILNKDLRCGISVKSINKAFPGLIPLTYNGGEKPAIMLLKNYDPKKLKYPCLAAFKKDGVRARFVNGSLISRQGHKIIGCGHIEEALKDFNRELDGELCVHGMAFDTASGLIRSDDPVPDAVYYVFDIPSHSGTKYERTLNLSVTFQASSHIKLIKHMQIPTESHLKRFYQESLAAGEEGIVIYDIDSPYEDKKSYDWMRMVPIKTADCTVVDFFEGNGKHAGSLGGIIISYKGHGVRVGTGFSEKVLKSQLKQIVREDDKKLLSLKSFKLPKGSIEEVSPILQKIRQFIWDNQDQFIGVVAEVEFKEETKAGSMRQPRFKCWRFDK